MQPAGSVLKCRLADKRWVSDPLDWQGRSTGSWPRIMARMATRANHVRCQYNPQHWQRRDNTSNFGASCRLKMSLTFARDRSGILQSTGSSPFLFSRAPAPATQSNCFIFSVATQTVPFGWEKMSIRQMALVACSALEKL